MLTDRGFQRAREVDVAVKMWSSWMKCSNTWMWLFLREGSKLQGLRWPCREQQRAVFRYLWMRWDVNAVAAADDTR